MLHFTYKVFDYIQPERTCCAFDLSRISNSHAGPGWLNELGSCRTRVDYLTTHTSLSPIEDLGGSMSQEVVGPGWLNELGRCRIRVDYLTTHTSLSPIEDLGGSRSQEVRLPNNSYKPITNTVWVRAQLYKLQKECTRLAAASDGVLLLLPPLKLVSMIQLKYC